MPATDPDELTQLLRERMEELLFEIIEIQDYLSKEQFLGQDYKLPLGIMGQVLSTGLQYDTLSMLDKTEQVLCEKASGSWEKIRASRYLDHKIHALAFFMRILSQLPAVSQSAHDMVQEMVLKARQRCREIETTLAAINHQVVA